MALSRVETQVTWSAASSVTLSTAAAVASDAFIFNDADFAASLQISADNASTPNSGDTVACYLAWTTGDVVGGGGNDFDTYEHSQFIMLLDTYATNTPGEDPAVKTVDIPVSATGFVLYVFGAQANSRNIVVKARVSAQRSA